MCLPPFTLTPSRFSYRRNLEDIVGLAITRAALLSTAYAVGLRYVHRWVVGQHGLCCGPALCAQVGERRGGGGP